MLNGRAILIGILCVLFLVSAVLGQEQSEQSDSHIITVTKKIDVAELDENVGNLNRTVEDLNETVGDLNETVGELNKTVGELNKAYAKIDERTSIILTLLCLILGAIILPPLGRLAWSKLPIKDKKSKKTSSTNLLRMLEFDNRGGYSITPHPGPGGSHPESTRTEGKSR